MISEPKISVAVHPACYGNHKEDVDFSKSNLLSDFIDMGKQSEFATCVNIYDRPRRVAAWVAAGADPNQADENGDSVLHHYVRENDYEVMHHGFAEEIFKRLMSLGCDPDRANHSGETPFRMARTRTNFTSEFLDRMEAIYQARKLERAAAAVGMDPGELFLADNNIILCYH